MRIKFFFKRDCRKAAEYVVSADWTLPAEVINVANGPVAVDCGRIRRQRIAQFNCFSRALAAEITCDSRSTQRLSTNIVLTELLQGSRSRQILTTAPSQCRKNSVKISCSVSRSGSLQFAELIKSGDAVGSWNLWRIWLGSPHRTEDHSDFRIPSVPQFS